LRALQSESALDSLYVIGTPCSDNTTTANFHRFLSLLDPNPDTISYLEFRADYHVELRFDDGRRETIPFLKLPLTKLPSDFFPLTCRTCVDYTNALADITVGYMGGEGDQWLIVRNERGAELLSLIESELILEKPGSAGKRDGAVKGFQTNVERAAGGLPLRSMPDWLRPVMAWLMPRIGPRGMEFARARVEMKAIETILHLRREKPRQLKSMVPDHVWRLVELPGRTMSDDAIRSVSDYAKLCLTAGLVAVITVQIRGRVVDLTRTSQNPVRCSIVRNRPTVRGSPLPMARKYILK
jgi:coenzyme F420 hydrogenase subunit beta